MSWEDELKPYFGVRMRYIIATGLTLWGALVACVFWWHV